MTDNYDLSRPSVLLGFRGENVRSFRDPLEFSMVATAMAEKKAVREVPWREGGQPLRVLTVAGLFGANASGKSNVLKAMDDMRSYVLFSFRSARPSGGIPRHGFLLDSASRDAASRYEIDLVLDGVRWEYGFALDEERVLHEWAYRWPKGRAALVFERSLDDVRLGADRAKSRAILDLLRPNALFLSTAASANHPTLRHLYAWFERNLLLAEADTRAFRQALTTAMLDNEDSETRERVLALLRAADLGISGAVKQELDPVMKERLQRAVRILMGDEGEPDGSHDGPELEELGVRLVHRGMGEDVQLDARDESLGTRVWFGLAGQVVHALQHGSVFLADELDASLHPALVEQLIRLFRDEATNPRRAQLVFNSHDATLLDGTREDRLLGRDQVWFTEKSDAGATRLYPLADLDPRREEAVGKRYLAGRYGATPILSRQEFAAVTELITSGKRS